MRRLIFRHTVQASGRRFAAGEDYTLPDVLSLRLLRDHPESVIDITDLTNDEVQALALELAGDLTLLVRSSDGEIVGDEQALEAQQRSAQARREVCGGRGNHFLGWNDGAYLEVGAPPKFRPGKGPGQGYWALARPHAPRVLKDRSGVPWDKVEVWLWPPLAEARRQSLSPTPEEARKQAFPGDVLARGLQQYDRPQGERHLLPLPTRVKCYSCGAMSTLRAVGSPPPAPPPGPPPGPLRYAAYVVGLGSCHLNWSVILSLGGATIGARGGLALA